MKLLKSLMTIFSVRSLSKGDQNERDRKYLGIYMNSLNGYGRKRKPVSGKVKK
jgi:hypothetical protein